MSVMERCEVCKAEFPRDTMHPRGRNAAGVPRYRCASCFALAKTGQSYALIPGAAARFYDADKDMYCLTAMWRAAGEERSKEPSQWLRLPESREFLGALNMGLSHIIATRGRNGGTWAHWQVAVAYAKYLSPEFHIQWNEYAAAYLRGERRSNPGVVVTPAAPTPTRIAAVVGELLDLLRAEVRGAISAELQSLGLPVVPQQTAEIADTLRGVTVIERETVRVERDEWVANGYCYLFVNDEEGVMACGKTHKEPMQRINDSDYNGGKGERRPWRILWAFQTDNRDATEKLMHRLIERAGAIKVRGEVFRHSERIAVDFGKLPRKLRHEQIRVYVEEARLFAMPLFMEVQ